VEIVPGKIYFLVVLLALQRKLAEGKEKGSTGRMIQAENLSQKRS
jgi:hypothetical protein